MTKTKQLVEGLISDIAAGGVSIPGSDPGYIALWAVNFAGQVNITHFPCGKRLNTCMNV